MTIYSISHDSRNLVIGNSYLYLEGDDLDSRNLLISKSNLEGRITARTYDLNSRSLTLTGVAHIGRLSRQTLIHASRSLIIQRSTLIGVLTGSALFPEIVPSQIQFKPARYVITEHYAQSGDLELQLWTDSSAGATLQLDYSNISDTAAETVMALWDSLYGTYKYVRIPQTVLAGVRQELVEYMLKGGSNSRWFFADAPKWNGKLKGYGDLKVMLISKISTLALNDRP